jgi:hypothetical protein
VDLEAVAAPLKAPLLLIMPELLEQQAKALLAVILLDKTLAQLPQQLVAVVVLAMWAFQVVAVLVAQVAQAYIQLSQVLT